MISRYKFSRVLLRLVVSMVFLMSFCFSYSVSAAPFEAFLSTDETEKKQKGSTNKKATTVKKTQTQISKTPKAEMQFSDIQNILSLATKDERKKILSDKKAFSDFVNHEAIALSVLMAAMANQVETTEQVRILAQRSVDNIVREVYLSQILTSRTPDDFPSEEQTQEYYEENKDQFVIEERIHVWQIFLPLSEDMKLKEIESMKRLAKSISSALGKKKIDFYAAASKHSKHEASRLHGGYLGMVNVSELKPEFRALIASLKPEEASQPIKTDEGLHILKLGAIVPKQEVTFQQAQFRIKESMLEELRIQIREAIFKEAGIRYPIYLKDKKLEKWRLKLTGN